jgi:alpha-mannosidase
MEQSDVTQQASLSEILPTIAKLRQLTQINVQSGWHSCDRDLPITELSSSDSWQLATPNEKGYLCWEKGHQVRWFVQQFTIPNDIQGYPLQGLSLRIGLTWWAEQAQVFVDGKLIQEGDLFDSSTRILLAPAVNGGEKISVALRLISPGHDIGALMRSQLIYEGTGDAIEPGFVADELTVLYKYLQAFNPEKLNDLANAIAKLDWHEISNVESFDRNLASIRQTLQPLAESIKQRCFHLLGHAHLDMAWLWTTDETWNAAERTFSSVLNLQKDFPDLTFCHTSPALFAWIEKHRPDLFAAIQGAVKQRSWEILGGMWIEPEVTLISGESLVRQLLYGQRYTEEKFGAIAKIAWLPDSFGFSWQLPQIFAQSGIEYFVTGKLHWNDTNKFPHGCFWWQSPDGTKLLTLMSPPNVTGVMDTHPLTMADYAIAWESQTELQDAFWLPGVGDHGGGPTRDMLEVRQRWQKSPFFPQTKFTTASNYLQHIASSDRRSPIPLWNDELYLEFHRGCYTTHADQKSFNRRCERLLYQAELWASCATILLGCDYPQAEIEAAWKKVLFNQFHDILPGTSIPEVFTEANRDWQTAETTGLELLNQSLEAIASQISLPRSPHPDARPIIIFNSLNWQRSEIIECELPGENWQVCDAEGKSIPSQLSADGKLLFLAADVPSIGYRLFWLYPSQRVSLTPEIPRAFILENDRLKVIVNPETGNLDSIFDKIQQREILNSAGNQLQAFEDKGQYWDAWNIDPNYSDRPLAPTSLKSIQYLECGSLRSRVRVIRNINLSQFCQDYVLDVNSSILKIQTTVDWQETHVLVKAAFPLQLESDFATYEIPCGAIQRSTNPQNTLEKAKWEVYALNWADLSSQSQDYGVSLLNDCKYGYDSQPSQLRLTLLRSPVWPDPNADRGIHRFTYAIYPHQGDWQSAKTVRAGYELNTPLLLINKLNQTRSLTLNSSRSLLNISAENAIVMALKQSQDDANAWILRCYECQGETTDFSVKGLELILDGSVNLLERPTQTETKIEPWKIVSFKLTRSENGDR